MRSLLVLAMMASTTYSFAQTAAKAKPDAYAKTITADDLKKHLFIVAGKEMEGRETATEGQRKAAAYIENHFRQLGLQPGAGSGYQQFFNVYQDSLLNANLEINGQAYSLDKDFGVNIANNISGTLRFSEVTFVNAADTNALKAANLTSKLVIMFGNNANMSRAAAMATNNLIRSKGIAAILSVSSQYPRTTPASRKGNQSINAFRRTLEAQQYPISEAVAKTILGADFDAAKAGTLGVKSYNAAILLQTNKATTTLQSSNVLGVLPGTDLKDEYLFITAHYDHLGKRDTVIFYGADDDGSGTVGVLEIAEAFVQAKKAGKGPRRSIVFMTVSGEEKGLWGSEHYSNYPLFPLDKTTADLNIDMIGRSDVTRKGDTTNYIYVVGDDKLSSDLKIISEAQNKKYTKLELDYKYNDPADPNMIYYRSDHYNFARKGVPIIFYYDGMLGADYHRATDTPEKINYPLAAKRAQLVFYTAWEMANRNEMLKRDLELPALRR
jgi:Zn-dependent M28 family amino/carboxypeptidase